jgi:hypothetical protein
MYCQSAFSMILASITCYFSLCLHVVCMLSGHLRACRNLRVACRHLRVACIHLRVACRHLRSEIIVWCRQRYMMIARIVTCCLDIFPILEYCFFLVVVSFLLCFVKTDTKQVRHWWRSGGILSFRGFSLCKLCFPGFWGTYACRMHTYVEGSTIYNVQAKFTQSQYHRDE